MIDSAKLARYKKPLLIAVGSFAALMLFLAFGLPPIVRSVAVDKLTAALHRPVALGEVRIQPFTLEVALKDFSIGEPDGSGTFLSFDELLADFQISSLFRRAAILRELTLTAPKVSILRRADLSYNFSDLLVQKDTKPQEPPPEDFHFFLGNLRIVNGEVSVDNRPTATRHQISAIDLFLPVVSNLPVYMEEFAKPRLSFAFDGSPVALEGETKPFADSLETHFAIDLKNLDLPRYVAYAPTPLGFDLASAFLDLDLKLAYVQHREKVPTLDLSGVAALRDVAVKEKGGAPLFSTRRVAVSLAPSDLMAREVHVAEALCEAPELTLTRDREGVWNVQRIASAEGLKEVPPENAKAEIPLKLTVDKARVTDGIAHVADFSPATLFRTELSGLTVDLEAFALPANTIRRAAFSVKTEAGETVEAEAGGALEPVLLDGKWKLAGLKIPKYRAYYQDRLRFAVERADLDVSGDFHLEGEEKATVSNLALALSGLRLKKPDEPEPFFELASLRVEGGEADKAARTASLGRLALSGPKVRASRDAQGKLSLEELTASETEKAPAPPAPVATEAEKPWTVLLKTLDLQGGQVDFADAQPPGGANLALRDITVKGENLTNEANRKGRIALSLKTGQKGALSVSGPLTLNPLAGEGAVKIGALDLTQLNPYLAAETRAALTGADLSLQGRAKFSRAADGKTASTFDGEAEVAALRLVDRETAEEIVRWGALAVKGISWKSDPAGVSVEAVSLTDPYFRVDVAPDGEVNLTALKKKKEEPAPSATPATEGAEKPLSIVVQSVAMNGATIDFSDRHIQPSYRMQLVDLSGRVSRMSSEEAGGGAVNLFGSIERYAPMEITGFLNPFAKDLLVDLKVEFRNVELSPMTPYSSRYLGYKIAKGKLGLALQYKILGRKLDSQNRILFDQFALGDAVESPEAVNLPVRFALALLTDRDGKIDLDVPVSGTLDDPDFSYGKVIWKVLVNILVKAVTSPFALLGSLFGGGEELSYAVFAPASHTLDGPESAKIEKLRQALLQRPALKLEVQGHVDPEKDKLALRDAALERKLKAQKIKEAVKAGRPAQPVEAVTLTPEERPLVVAALFAQEKIPKPASTARALTPDEMEKLILSYIQIVDDDLRALAGDRAREVISLLVGKGDIDPARVFLTEPKELKPSPREGVPDSRVDFALQ